MLFIKNMRYLFNLSAAPAPFNPNKFGFITRSRTQTVNTYFWYTYLQHLKMQFDLLIALDKVQCDIIVIWHRSVIVQILGRAFAYRLTNSVVFVLGGASFSWWCRVAKCAPHTSPLPSSSAQVTALFSFRTIYYCNHVVLIHFLKKKKENRAQPPSTAYIIYSIPLRTYKYSTRLLTACRSFHFVYPSLNNQ